MIKGILFFVLVWVCVAVGAVLFRAATKKERWSAAKTGVFGFVTALIAVAIVVSMVVIF